PGATPRRTEIAERAAPRRNSWAHDVGAVERRTGKGAPGLPASARVEGAMRAGFGRAVAPTEHGHDRRFRSSHRTGRDNYSNRDRASWTGEGKNGILDGLPAPCSHL